MRLASYLKEEIKKASQSRRHLNWILKDEEDFVEYP